MRELALLRQKIFSQLAECFSGFIPGKMLEPSEAKSHSRCRIFSKANTFWAFFSQVIDADGGCKEVVRKIQAYTSVNALKLPASSTSAYCQARKKLEHSELMNILTWLADYLKLICMLWFFNIKILHAFRSGGH